MQLHRRPVRFKRRARVNDEPAEHLPVIKKLLAVLIPVFPRIIIDHIIRAGHLQLMHLDRAIYIDIITRIPGLHVPHQKSAHRNISGFYTFLTQLTKKRIYIILNIDLRIVAHIADLPDIFRYLSLHNCIHLPVFNISPAS